MAAALGAWAVAATAVADAQGILAARVNGAGITQERLERGFEEDLRQRQLNLLQVRNPERVKQMKRAVLENLIEQELFWQAATKAGISAAAAEVDQALEATRGQFKSAEAYERRLRIEGYTPETYRELVTKQVHAKKYALSVAAKAAAVTDEEIHRFYVENPGKFHRPEQLRARQILVKVAPGAGEAERAEKRALIERILKDARAGEDFGKLARLHSEAPTRQWGGEMEAFGRGQVPQPVEDAVFALSPGQVSGVVGTAEGFQILKLDSRHEAVTVSEEAAREAIGNHLRETRAVQAVGEEARRLRASEKIEILLPL